MKLSILSVTVFCVSLSSLPAWAGMPQSTSTQSTTQSPTQSTPTISRSTSETTNTVPVDPAVLTTQGGAADLAVEARSLSAPTADRTETLNGTAEQINQNLANPSDQQSSPGSVGAALSLPEGMVIRGVNRGGLAIGSELPQ